MFRTYDIKEIRILPMCNTQQQKEYGFENDDEVRDYLSEGLPSTEKGKYYYKERGIDLYDTDALILFQYGGRILGYGIYKDRNCDDRYFQFYPESIHNVEEISADEVRSVYPSFKRFVRMQKIPLDYLEAITPLLKRKQKLFVASKH